MNARVFLLTTFASVTALACAAQGQSVTRNPEALYLSVEVMEGGHTVGKPKVVGFEGRHITVERRQPDAPVADYKLVLLPREEGSGYGVKLDLQLPSGRRLGHVGLLHGEERRVVLDEQTELKVMLMRVDSPEFKALVQRGTKLNAKPAI